MDTQGKRFICTQSKVEARGFGWFLRYSGARPLQLKTIRSRTTCKNNSCYISCVLDNQVFLGHATIRLLPGLRAVSNTLFAYAKKNAKAANFLYICRHFCLRTHAKRVFETLPLAQALTSVLQNILHTKYFVIFSKASKLWSQVQAYLGLQYGQVPQAGASLLF